MEVCNLRAYLANVGMSMKEFSDRINYNPSYLRMIAAGKVSPSFRLARDIRNATGGVVDLETQTKKGKKNQNEHNENNN